MSDSTSNSVSFPINPDSNDKRPLPEIIADVYGFALAHVDHVDGNRYYAIQDWIRGVAQPADATKFWDAMKRRLKKAGIDTSTWCRSMSYRVSDGRTYKRDHAQAEILYQITQRMDANTGLRDKVLEFLAKSGVVIDEMRIDPDLAMNVAIAGYRRQGRSEAFILVRFLSIQGRNIFTVEFQRSMSKPPQRWMYGVITDVLRIGIWKRTTAQLRAQMKLKKDANLRDHQSALALTYEMLAEHICAVALRQKSNLEFNESKQIVRSKSESVGRHAQETSRELGIDIATSTDDNTLPLDQSFPLIDG